MTRDAAAATAVIVVAGACGIAAGPNPNFCNPSISVLPGSRVQFTNFAQVHLWPYSVEWGARQRQAVS